ncbi:hypothetical protein HCT46_03555 [Spirochaetales bacterium BR208]|uniref:Lipoprotein n=1 Tax=Entomospira nematocerorum TaxID=2719987 RepID=A0A968GD02_9SPIO|nr:hypothetical protein [Entomospira nematocera]NIZ46989.1 hypothetical protein [Entomospira nematocera]
MHKPYWSLPLSVLTSMILIGACKNESPLYQSHNMHSKVHNMNYHNRDNYLLIGFNTAHHVSQQRDRLYLFNHPYSPLLIFIDRKFLYINISKFASHTPERHSSDKVNSSYHSSLSARIVDTAASIQLSLTKHNVRTHTKEKSIFYTNHPYKCLEFSNIIAMPLNHSKSDMENFNITNI